MDRYKIETKATNSKESTAIVNLILCMTTVPEKYDWESSKEVVNDES